MSEELLHAISPLGVDASVAAAHRLTDKGSDRRAALTRQLQQLEYEARQAFEQYNHVDPTNRLVAEVLEQRWEEKLRAVEAIKGELDALEDGPPPLGDTEKAAILALGGHFASVWNDPLCPMVLKKKIARTVIDEIIVDLDDESQQLQLIIHWHGGCHTAFQIPKPQSGAVAHKTALEDVELVRRMAPRYGDDEIARVLSKLGRRTGKGKPWTQSRVAYVRNKYDIPKADQAKQDTNVLTLSQATRYCGVSDTTLMRLIKQDFLAYNQVAPYAPLEISGVDLDTEPVAGILRRLTATGKLALEGNRSANQMHLFD